MRKECIVGTLVLFSIIVAAVLVQPASAVWEEDGVPVCSAFNCQGNQALVSDGTGGAIVSWEDTRSGGSPDLYIQRINGYGNAFWQYQGVSLCTAVDAQTAPRMIPDGTGGSITVWQDFRNGSNSDVFARRVDASGNPLWTANGVPICEAADEQQSPQIASDGAGGAIMTWQDLRVGVDNDIYAQRVDASGSVKWTVNGIRVCGVLLDQELPEIVSDAAGGAIIVWQDFRSGAGYDIYAQRINASGSAVWAQNGIPVCTASGNQWNLVAVPDGTGGAIIAWEDYRNGQADVFAQHVNAAGAMGWAEGGIQVCATASSKTYIDMSPDGVGGALVVWQDRPAGEDDDIVAQRVDWYGTLKWGDSGVTVCGDTANQYTPHVASDGAGGAMVAWEDWRNEFAGDIYAQRVDAAGNLRWMLDGVGVCVLPGSQTSTQIAADGAGGAIVAWTDASQWSNTNVFIQRMDRNGDLIGVGPEVPAPVSMLEQNVPNPFNPVTVIHFALAERGQVKLVVYDVTGRQVRTLLDEVRDIGRHEATWDGRDDSGVSVASGVYMYMLQAPGYIENKKMVLLR